MAKTVADQFAETLAAAGIKRISLCSVDVEGRQYHLPVLVCARHGVHSDEVKLLSRFSQSVPELGMSELDQLERSLGRGQALEIYGSELGDDVMSVDARRGNWPVQPRHDP